MTERYDRIIPRPHQFINHNYHR